MAEYVFAPKARPALPVIGSGKLFPSARVLGIGANYSLEPVAPGDRKEAFYFSKDCWNMAVALPGETLELPYPAMTSSLVYESELVVAIGRASSGPVAPEDAMDYVWGYAAGIDFIRKDAVMHLRGLGFPWEKAKAYPGSAVVTPVVEKSAVADPSHLRVWLDVDGRNRQDGNTSQMIYSVAEIIAQVSQWWGLTEGDLIFTGTPAGPDAVARGSALEGGVEGVGSWALKLV